MKSFIIIVSIFLFVKIQNSHGREIKKVDANSNSKKSPDHKNTADKLQSIAGKGTIDNEVNEVGDNLKIKLDEIKERAIDSRETALLEALQAYKDAKEKAEKLWEESNLEQIKNQDIIDQKFKKAEIIMDAVWRNESKQWSDMWHRANNEYDELISRSRQKKEKAEKKRELAMQQADEQFSKVYAEIEENKLRAENKYKDVLEKGRVKYENAVKAAEEKKSKAEKEFGEVSNKYKVIPIEELTKVKAQYGAEMRAYEKALQQAQKEWQKLLGMTGIGKQYEEALDKAFNELLKGQELATSLASELYLESDKDLQKAEELKKNTKNQIDADQKRARRAHKENIEKSKIEYQKALQNIQKRAEEANALLGFEMKIARVKYDKAVNEANREFEKTIGGTDQRINDGKKRYQSPRKRQSDTKNRTQTGHNF